MVASLIRSVWLLFLIFYSAMLAGAVGILITIKLVKFRDVALRDRAKKLRVAAHFFNLGGVPPLIGFAVKLIALKNIIPLGLALTLTLVLLSVIVLYIYTRIMYQAYTVTPRGQISIPNTRVRKSILISIALLISLSTRT